MQLQTDQFLPLHGEDERLNPAVGFGAGSGRKSRRNRFRGAAGSGPESSQGFQPGRVGEPGVVDAGRADLHRQGFPNSK